MKCHIAPHFIWAFRTVGQSTYLGVTSIQSVEGVQPWKIDKKIKKVMYIILNLFLERKLKTANKYL